MPRQAGLRDSHRRARRCPTAGELILAVVVPCSLYLGLQFVGLVLHIIGAAHSGLAGRTDLYGTLGSACSAIAWAVMLVGVARLAVKLRALAATRALRRRERYR